MDRGRARPPDPLRPAAFVPLAAGCIYGRKAQVREARKVSIFSETVGLQSLAYERIFDYFTWFYICLLRSRHHLSN